LPYFLFFNNSTSGRGRIWDRWKKREDEATAHFDYANTGRRVYVGNLPSFDMKPARVDAEIKHFFNGFQMYVHIFHPIVSEKKSSFPSEAISKIIPPHPSNLTNGHYLFVDFSTTDEASRAIRQFNGATCWDRAVKVNHTKGGHSWKVEERDRYLQNRGRDQSR
jgi:hypothetical protein